MVGRPGVVSTRGPRPGTAEEFAASIRRACQASAPRTHGEGEPHASAPPPVIIDVRGVDAFAVRRLDPTSGLLWELGVPIAHFDYSRDLEGVQCKVNGSLLPARDVPIFLVLSAERADEQLAWFALEAEVVSGDSRRTTTRRGWTVGGSIAFADDLDDHWHREAEAWAALDAQGIAVVEGPEGHPAPDSPAFRPRLWRPTEIAPVALERLREMDWGSGGDTRLLGVDLACGAGRDGLFLLEAVLEALGPRQPTWQWAFVDHLKGGGERLCALADSRSLPPGTAIWVTADLKKDGCLEEAIETLLEPPEAGLREGRLGCVTMSRFLHRPLLPAIRSLIQRRASAQGCVLGVVHFEGLDACIKWGHPKSSRDVLGDGELAAAVESWGPGWSIHHNALPLAPDRVRSVRVFVATYTPEHDSDK